MKEQESTDTTTKRRWSLFRICLWLLIFLLLGLILIPLLFQLQPVQNWAVGKAAKKLSDRTGAEVTVDHIDFSIFDGLILEKVFISEPDNVQDTLAYIGSFSTSLEENISSLFSNSLKVNDVNIRDVVLNIKTDEGHEISNLQSFLSKLSTKSKQSQRSGKKMGLELNSVNFSNIALKISDAQNSLVSLEVNEGSILIDRFDLENLDFEIEKLMLSEPRYIEVRNGKKKDADETADAELTVTETPEEANPLSISIHYMEISGGLFSRDDWHKAAKAKNKSLDVSHLHISEINLNADSTLLTIPFNLESQIKSLTLVEDNGFQIDELNVAKLVVDEKQIALDNFVLNTGKSKLGEKLVFTYDEFGDFKSFAEEIELDADLRDSKLSFQDLIYFFPELKNSSFSRQNSSKWMKLTGRLTGTIDELEAENLSLSFNDMIKLEGYLSTYDLTKSETALINLRFSRVLW